MVRSAVYTYPFIELNLGRNPHTFYRKFKLGNEERIRLNIDSKFRNPLLKIAKTILHKGSYSQ